ncbi:unnamed protein product, partial [Chrysoparadoxa australica]
MNLFASFLPRASFLLCLLFFAWGGRAEETRTSKAQADWKETEKVPIEVLAHSGPELAEPHTGLRRLQAVLPSYLSFLETWEVITPAAIGPYGGDTVTFIGTGFSAAADRIYTCLFHATAEDPSAGIEVPAIALDTKTVTCNAPAWPKIRQTLTAILMVEYDSKKLVVVNTQGEIESAQIIVTEQVAQITAAGTAEYPLGFGVQGGDTISFAGMAFDTETPNAYQCMFSVNGGSQNVPAIVINMELVSCKTPAVATADMAEVSLIYAGAPVRRSDPAEITLFGETVSLGAALEFLYPFQAVWVEVNAPLAVIPSSGGTMITVTGMGLDITKLYQCCLTSTAAPGLPPICSGVAAPISATSLACQSPPSALPDQTLNFSVLDGNGAALIDGASPEGGNTVLTVAAVWTSKTPGKGGAGGGDMVEVTGLGFYGAEADGNIYACVFGDEVVPATRLSSTLLSCQVPQVPTGSEAGPVSFSMATLESLEPVAYHGVAEVEDAAFTFEEEWSIGRALVSSSPGQGAAVASGFGFVKTRTYYCGFRDADSCPLGDNTHLNWLREEGGGCFKLSGKAIVDSAEQLTCIIPELPEQPQELFTEEEFILIKSTSPTSPLEGLVEVPQNDGTGPAGSDIGTLFSVAPSSAIITGGVKIDMGAFGLKGEASDFTCQFLSTEAGRSTPVTAYTPITRLTSACSEPSPVGTVTPGGMVDTAVACISCESPYWPYDAAQASLSLKKLASPSSGTKSFNFSFESSTPMHYDVVGVLELTGVPASDYGLSQVNELQEWLSTSSGLEPWACQVTSLNDASRSGRVLRGELRGRGLQAADTTLVGIAMATPAVGPTFTAADALSSAETAVQGVTANVKRLISGPITGAALLGPLEIGVNSAFCAPGYRTDASTTGERSCIPCEVGLFSGEGDVCVACPSGANCSTQATGIPGPMPGYWRHPEGLASSDFEAYALHQCFAKEACLGGPESLCAVGHVYGSPVCGVCDTGFYLGISDLCDGCGSNSSVRLRFGLVMFFVAAALVFAATLFLYTPSTSPALASLKAMIAATSVELISPSNSSINSMLAFSPRVLVGHLTSQNSGQPSNSLHQQAVVNSSHGGQGKLRDSAHTFISGTESTLRGEQFASSNHPPYGNTVGAGVSRGQNRLTCLTEDEDHSLSSDSLQSPSMSVISPLGISGFGRRGDKEPTNKFNFSSKPPLHKTASPSSASISSGDPRSVITGHSISTISTPEDNGLRRAWFQAQRQRRIAALSLVIIAYLQVLSSLRDVYDVTWPASLEGIFAAFSIVDLGFANIPSLSLRCIYPGLNFYDEWLICVLFLPVLALVLYLVKSLGTRLIVQSEPISQAEELQSELFSKKCWAVLTWASITVYPGVTRKLLQLFHCASFDGGASYLYSDLSVSCSGTPYVYYLVADVLLLACFTVGLPILLLAGLLSNKSSVAPISPPHDSQYAIGLLRACYKEGQWAREPLDLMRRLFLTGVLIFIRPGTTQAALALAVSILALCLHLKASPFVDNTANNLQGVLLTVIVVNTLTALLLQYGGETLSDGATNFLVAVNTLILALVIPCWLVLSFGEGRRVLMKALSCFGTATPHEGNLPPKQINENVGYLDDKSLFTSRSRHTISVVHGRDIDLTPKNQTHQVSRSVSEKDGSWNWPG